MKGTNTMQHVTAVRRTIAAAALVFTGFVATSATPASAQLGAQRKLAYVLTEYKYTPNTPLKVKKGETIVFTFTNKGKLPHEAFIATPADQAKHEKEMTMADGKTMPDTVSRVTMKPGETKKLTFKFTTAGKFEIACHELTHYPLGMKLPVTVS